MTCLSTHTKGCGPLYLQAELSIFSALFLGPSSLLATLKHLSTSLQTPGPIFSTVLPIISAQPSATYTCPGKGHFPGAELREAETTCMERSDALPHREGEYTGCGRV